MTLTYTSDLSKLLSPDKNSATHEALKGHGRCACTSAERCGVPRPGTMERTRQWRFHTHPEYVAYISETTSNPSVSPMSRLFSTTPFVTFWTYQITTRSQPLLNIHPKSNSSSWTLFFLKISLSLDMYTGCCCKIQRSSWNSYVGGFFCLGNFGSQKPFSGRTWGVVLKVQQFLLDVNVCLHLEIRNTIQGIVEETWMCSRGEWRWNSHPWLSHQERMWLQNGSYILGGQEAKFKNWIPNMSKPMSSSSTSISSWAWPGSWQNCTCPFTITNWCPMASDIAGLHLKFSHEKIIWNGYHKSVMSCYVMLCYVSHSSHLNVPQTVWTRRTHWGFSIWGPSPLPDICKALKAPRNGRPNLTSLKSDFRNTTGKNIQNIWM